MSFLDKTGLSHFWAQCLNKFATKDAIPSVEGLASETYVDNKVASMVDSAPETLNTLNELAAALGDDPNFATTVATEIGGKVSKNGDTMTGNLTIKKSTYPIIRLTENDTNKALNLQFASGIFDVSAFNAGDSANNYRTLRLVDSEYRSNVAHALSILDVVNGTRNTYNIYHEGNKPTAADVGALPISGGTLTGSLTMGDGTLFTTGHMNIGSSAGPYLYTGGTNFVVRYGNSSNYHYANFTEGGPIEIDGTAVSLTGHTHTPIDIGAFGALGNAADFGSNLNSFTQPGAVLISSDVANRPSETSIYGICWNVYGQVNTYLEQHYVNAATLKRYVRFRIENVWRAWAQEYDSNFKPTASDIGAAPAAHTHHNLIAGQGNAGELYWHDDFLLSSATRTVPSLHFGTALLYRHDSSASKYYPIYDEGNKPTPSAIGAMPLNPSSIEMSNGNGFIDFHFTGTSTDYTSRIIEDSENYLNINAFDGGKVKLGRVTAGTWQGSAIGLNYGGTGATTRAGAINNLFKIGTSPIASTTNDTVTKWTELGNGVAWYGTDGQLTDQPNTYGALLNLSAVGSEISQLWFSAPNGAVYHRGANGSGWSGTWTKFYDTSNKPTAADVGALALTGGTVSGAVTINNTLTATRVIGAVYA